MDRVTVGTRLPTSLLASAMESIHDVLVREHALSPRTVGELLCAYHRGDVCLARSADRLVGWVLCLQRGRRTQELAGAYVVPERRGSTVVSALLREALRRRPFTVCVTSDPKLSRYLRYWGFERCSPTRLLRLTGASMLRDRVSLSRLRYGGAYVRLGTIQLLVFDRAAIALPADPLGATGTWPRQHGEVGP